jgi:hypothetical protein
LLEHETVMQMAEVLIDIKLEKKVMEDWIYAQNSVVKGDLGNNYAEWKMDKKNNARLGVPFGRAEC